MGCKEGLVEVGLGKHGPGLQGFLRFASMGCKEGLLEVGMGRWETGYNKELEVAIGEHRAGAAGIVWLSEKCRKKREKKMCPSMSSGGTSG